jgi:8-oxo-dGTP diphosphatase
MALQQHYVATGYVYDKLTDSFLLILHKKLGKWLAPGGHLEAGEEPHEGALRELREETGLRGRIVNLLQAPEVGTPAIPQICAPFCILSETIPASSREGEHIHIDFVYVIEVEPADALNLLKEEVIQARWISATEIATLETFENVKKVCHAISLLGHQKAMFREETLLQGLTLEASPAQLEAIDVEQML